MSNRMNEWMNELELLRQDSNFKILVSTLIFLKLENLPAYYWIWLLTEGERESSSAVSIIQLPIF